MSLSHIYYTIQYYGGENINKIAIITLIIVAIGLVAGGFALVANGDVSSVADNPVSNEASNSSGDNASLDNSTVVKDVLSDNNMNNHFSMVFCYGAIYSSSDSVIFTYTKLLLVLL